MTHLSNIEIGNATESKISKLLREYGFWAKIMPKASDGSQPFDIAAVKGCEDSDKVIFLALDGKHVREKDASFKFTRAEENQASAFGYLVGFAKVSPKFMGFAIEFERSDEIYWLQFDKYLELIKAGKKSININELSYLKIYLNNLTSKNIVV